MARRVGFEPAVSGQTPVDESGNPVAVGVWGDSSTGIGVFGTSGTLPPGVDNIPANIAGVEGHSIDNPGVFGRSVHETGVQGESIESVGVIGRSQTGSGMLGVTFATSHSPGVFGSSTTGGDGVVGFVGDATGVIGNSIRGKGVYGISDVGNGVLGESFGGTGTDGRGTAAAGVFGRSDTGIGVQALSSSRDGTFSLTYGEGFGLFGLHFSNDGGGGVFGESVLGNGVEGFTFGAGDTAAIRGESANGLAGLFIGDVRVSGAIFKGGGGFEIDHPLDPENKYLSHSFVESPDMLNVYSGNAITDAKGDAVIALPDYFEALNHDVRYQLTVIGQFAQAMVAQEITGNRFAIKTDKAGVKVSWQVTGIRKDAWAARNRIAVEAQKSAEDKGRYLHPEVCDKSDELKIHRNPRREGQLRRITQLVPEEHRQPFERQLRALLRGDSVDRNELRRFVTAAAQLSTQPGPEEPQRMDRARLQQQWKQVEEMVDRLRHPKR